MVPNSAIAGHAHHELVWVVSGSVVVEALGRQWVVTTERTLWIPAGLDHRVLPRQGALVFPLWLEREPRGPLWEAPMLIQRTPYFAELAQVLLQPGLTSASGLAAAAAGIQALLPRLAEAGRELSLPEDPRARAVAEGLIANPASRRTLEDWARHVHTSSKTLQRSFLAEAHASFPEWRVRARLHAALPLLERGDQVAHVAAHVGYASTSAFISAFRKRYGHTPAKHRGRVS